MVEVAIIIFCLVRIPYILPLTAPSILFMKEYRTGKHKFYIVWTTVTLAIWLIWSAFWFIFLKAYNLAGYKGWASEIIGVVHYCPGILPFLYCLTAFFISAIAYIFFCYFLVHAIKLEIGLKRRILWYGWIAVLAVIFAVIHRNIKEISTEYIESISAFFNYLSFALKWMVFSLPATMKIGEALSDNTNVIQERKVKC